MSLSEAIYAVQQAEAKLLAAIDELELHKQDPDAHAALWQAIRELQESDQVYTRQEIVEIITEKLADHEAKTFDVAHPGFEDYNTALVEQIDALTASIEAIQNRLDGEAANSGQTDLQKELQAIEDKYAPILANLQESYAQAVEQGNDVLAETYRNSIQTTLDQKRDEMLAVMEEWQNSQGE